MSNAQWHADQSDGERALRNAARQREQDQRLGDELFLYKKILKIALADRDQARARLAAVGDVIAENGCNCDCDCLVGHEPHEEDCDPCLACRIQVVLK